MATIDFEDIQPWNGSTGTGADARGVVKRNFAKVNQNFAQSGGSSKTLKEVDDSMIPLSNTTDRLNKTVYGGVKDMTPTSWTNGCKQPNGVLNPTTTYSISPFIKVNKGETYEVCSSGSTNALIVSAYSSNTDGSFISGSSINIIGTTDVTVAYKHTFTIPDGVNYICIGKHNSTNLINIYLRQITDINSKGLIWEVEELSGIEEEVTNIRLAIYGNNKDVTPKNWINGCLKPGGIYDSTTTYRTSAYIAVTTGQKFKVRTGGSTGMYIVSAYSSNTDASFISGSAINMLGNTTPTVISEYELIIPNGVKYIRISRNNNIDISLIKLIEITDETQEKGVLERLDNLETNSSVKGEFKIKRSCIITIIADDLNATDTKIIEILNNYKIPATFALITNRITTSNIDI